MENDDKLLNNIKLEEWVMEKCENWRDHYQTNYKDKHSEYYRLWRGVWADSDSLRETERSRIITPALQQAVESSVAEIEEATFGRGAWFDIRDDYQDKNGSTDVEFLKTQLTEDMTFAKARTNISEVILNAAIYGTGIGEIYLDEIKEHIPAIQTTPDGQTQQVGVMEKKRFLVKLRPIMMGNFLIDPLAASIEEALGVAIDMYVPLHQIEQDQEKGFLRDVVVETVESDNDLEPDENITVDSDSRVRLTRYYGLVPRHLLEDAEEDELEEDEIAVALGAEDKDDESGYVEAIVIIANGTTLLKAVANPYMMEDRPVVAFKWDAVPGKFLGRGICEKGYNSQKALDTELRARIDALALTVHPMMAVDAQRMPRGSQFKIAPGKTLLTNGNPSEILQPFKFGAVDNITFTQGAQLQNMVQQATGAVDTAGMAGMGADGTSSGISMSLGAIIKRHKRTLLNFQDNFLIPFVQKVAHRYMQFDPDLYKAQDMKFVASSSLGIIAREYEVTQLVQLLQTMPADNPAYQLLVSNIVESMNLSKREQILGEIEKANQPNPQAQEEQKIRKQFELEIAKANLQQIQLQNQEIQSRIKQNEVETQLLPVAEETDRISAIAKTLPADEFKQAIEMAELSLKRQELEVKENIVQLQMRKTDGN